MLNHRWLTFLVITFLAVIVFIFFYLRLQPVWSPQIAAETAAENSEQTLSAPTISFVNPKKGASEPKVVIVVFGDFYCEPCRSAAQNMEILVKTVPEVQVVWKNMPNDSAHELASTAAVAAHCAGNQGKFWEYHDELFDNQVLLNNTMFSTLAQNLELDTEKFDKCLENTDTSPLVRQDLEEALALQITALPTFFIGEERYTGLMTADELITLVKNKIAAVK
ncbi:MAG: DSBA oxidoreductase family protein [Candidatus Uhrbacteria bacterium GW2011_GWE2_45_35]|uniref:DSBA oxidoreductase family protein n=1 Tax=Candidatus Uhrbacteria bacterium GW2011_GWE2_45_35 TaxID=1618993 RepID=A0A0G1PPY0_9BACT|nr:MAG: DSBA oxidoreductase family protein [Candidatus Uhrbacteria bacterium GW2011_GWE2_45_35]